MEVGRVIAGLPVEVGRVMILSCKLLMDHKERPSLFPHVGDVCVSFMGSTWKHEIEGNPPSSMEWFHCLDIGNAAKLIWLSFGIP